MSTLVETTPDKIRRLYNGQYLFFFTGGLDEITLPVGAEYVIVYGPTGHQVRGQAVRYRVVMGITSSTGVAVVKRRELTAEEMMHFKWLIGEREGKVTNG